jgi:hypothetical protein
MKNIHLIPTDKPSRLFLKETTLLLNNQYTLQEVFPKGKCQNIYITSDEEIKEGDWVITNNGLLAKVITEFTWHFINSKKIILTTDQDLIKDGVQAIDDEFLEWFVENPNCGYVDQRLIWDEEKLTSIYKIIIPKRGITINHVGKPKQESNFYAALSFAFSEKLKQYFEETPMEKVLEDWAKSVEYDNVGPTVNEFLDNTNKQKILDISKVTRVEVIQHSEPYNGRAYTNYNAKDVEIQLQDDNKTLKIFLK